MSIRADPAEFSLRGEYRVQSRRRWAASTLGGGWLHGRRFLLDSETVNHALREHSQWAGSAIVAMSPALVTHRSGTFASEPDILYKREFFRPEAGTAAMTVDIVDVRKSCENWRGRAQYAQYIFSEDTYSRIAAAMDDLEVVVANEYYLHEAGHFLGYDVLAKYRDGYFSPGGQTAWPLVYVEELRADLQAFGFAVRLLPPAEAAKILLYNVALRFGVHFEGLVTREVAPYGLTPYLLFCVLRDHEFISLVETSGRSRLQIANFAIDDAVRVMASCAAWAERELTVPEAATEGPIDRALIAAGWVRRRLSDSTYLAEYARLMNHRIVKGA